MNLSQVNTPIYNGASQKINFNADFQGDDATQGWTTYVMMTNVGTTNMTVEHTIPSGSVGNYIIPTVSPTMTPKTLTVNQNGTMTYNGSLQNVPLTIIGIEGTDEVTASTDQVKNAGSYSQAVTLGGAAANNYQVSSNVSITVDKFTLTVTQDGTLTYNGSLQDVPLSINKFGNDDVTASTVQVKDAGSYSEAVTLGGAAVNNYQVLGNVSITMTPYTLTLSQVSTPTYNGAAQQIDFNADFRGNDATQGWTTYVMMTNVGTTNMTVTHNIPGGSVGNYIIPKVSPTMIPYTLSLSQVNTPIYNGAAQRIDFNADFRGNDATQGWTTHVMMTNVGTTDMTVEHNIPSGSVGNYIIPTVSPTMTPKTLTVNQNGTMTYNGSLQNVPLTIIGIEGTDEVTASTDQVKNAGSYSQAVTLGGAAANNYQVSSNVSITVDKFTLTVNQSGTLTYNGALQDVPLSINKFGDDDVTASTAQVKNAGSYSQAVTCINSNSKRNIYI